MAVPILMLAIVGIMVALFSPAIIKVWQLAFTKIGTGGPTLWAIVAVAVVLLMLRKNRQEQKLKELYGVR